MAFAEVGSGSQRASANNSGTPGEVTCAYPGSVTAGNLLIAVAIWWRSAGASGSASASDDRSTSFSSIISDAITLGTGTYRVGIFYGLAGGSGANTVTFDFVDTVFASVSIDEFSGPHASPLSVSSTTPNTGSSTDPTATLNTLTSGELVIGIAGHGHGTAPTLAVDAPATQFGEKETDDVDMAHSAAYRVGGAAGAHAIDWTVGTSVAWGTLIASFKAADGGGGSSTTDGAILIRPVGFA